jgi:hypothetical protein
MVHETVPDNTGGSSPVSLRRAEYRTMAQSLGISDQFNWTFNSGGDDSAQPLDLTSPQNPTVVEAGLWAVTLTVQSVNTHAGAHFLLNLSLDDSGFGWLVEAGMPLDGPSWSLYCNVSSTVYLPAGGVLAAYTSHDIGAAADFNMWATVQQIAK